MSHTYLDQLAVPVMALDASLRIVYCNSAAIALLDKPDDALRHQLVADVFPEWHDSDLARTVQTCLATGAPQTMQGWWRTRCFSFQATAVDAGVLLAAHDVTERERALRDLHEHKTNLGAIMDAIPESLSLIAADGTVLAINNAAAQRLHTTAAKLIGTCVYGYLPPALAAARKARVDEVLATGIPAHFEDTRGDCVFANWIFPVPSDARSSCRVVVFAVDVTDLRRQERDLRASEARYRAFYENLPLTTVTWQMDGDDFVLVNVNRAAEEEANAKAEHLIGQRASVLYHDQPAMRDILRDTAQSRGRQQRDVQYISLLRHKLHSITCTCGFVPPNLVIMHIEDISRRRHAESKLRHYQRQLRALAAQLTLVEERERRRIAADLHDHVCQTLAAIKLKLGVLAENIAIKTAATNLRRTMAMLDQCIRATRDLSFDLSPPVLHELGLDAALEWLADHLQTKRLAIRVAKHGEPAALPDDLRVLLFIVTREVVINAIKHAAAQTITITRTTAAGQLCITVHDDGRGFADGQSTALRTRRGFGLFSIRERLRNVGGAIDIATAPDAGTTVEIMLPLSCDAERP